jgi:1,4-dihydroxy-2-naphthoate polyprenyltransferase
MATPQQWLAGARPRTLAAAIAPVIVGTALAHFYDSVVWGNALLALIVALSLQVGVNYANDYSDGIRGTDDNRVGPLRLTGSKLASPRAVRTAALIALGVAAAAGVTLAAITTWWLLDVGAVCLVAAWFYTGGKRPYGYFGLGELVVFVFFGLVAVVGTTYVQLGLTPLSSWVAGTAIGALACAILVVNNLRDIPTDLVAGKRTLAVRLGDQGTRYWYVALVLIAAACVVWLALLTHVFVLVGLSFLVLAGPAIRSLLAGAQGLELVPVLARTGMAEVVMSIGIAFGYLVGHR